MNRNEILKSLLERSDENKFYWAVDSAIAKSSHWNKANSLSDELRETLKEYIDENYLEETLNIIMSLCFDSGYKIGIDAVCVLFGLDEFFDSF